MDLSVTARLALACVGMGCAVAPVAQHPCECCTEVGRLGKRAPPYGDISHDHTSAAHSSNASELHARSMRIMFFSAFDIPDRIQETHQLCDRGLQGSKCLVWKAVMRVALSEAEGQLRSGCAPSSQCPPELVTWESGRRQLPPGSLMHGACSCLLYTSPSPRD